MNIALLSDYKKNICRSYGISHEGIGAAFRFGQRIWQTKSHKLNNFNFQGFVFDRSRRQIMMFLVVESLPLRGRQQRVKEYETAWR